MTLDEAIKHAEEVAQEKQYEYQECLVVHDMKDAMECLKCGEEHRQLAEWLKDYKRLSEQEHILDKIRDEIRAMEGDIETIADVLTIVDNYKVERSDKE